MYLSMRRKMRLSKGMMENTAMISSNQIEARLHRGYRHKVVCRSGNSEEYAFDVKEKCAIVDIVIYLNNATRTAVIWNNQYRREMGSKTHCFSWNQEINEARISDGFIDAGNRQFRVGDGLADETVLIMSFDTLSKNINNLYELIQGEKPNAEEIHNEEIRRGRRTVSRWNRDCDFRIKVLNAYGKQCAVCRCTEVKILEAAHIKAVADGGSDDVSNGICLCANHHRMFDEKLIQIDFRSLCLPYVADSVKGMPWYDVFIANGGKLLPGKKEK